MNNSDMKSLLKVILVCVVLILVSPFLFSFLGVVFKLILWVILAIIIVVSISIMIFKHKVKKELKEDGFINMENNSHSNDTVKTDEVDIDYGDAPIVDVYEYEEENDDDKNDK